MRSKFLIATPMVIGISLVCWLALLPQHPKYQGRTVEEWFERYCTPPSGPFLTDTEVSDEAGRAMQHFGTNALPYLYSLINREADYSSAERIRIEIRKHLPKPQQELIKGPPHADRGAAAGFIANEIHPPTELLIPSIKPAMESTNVIVLDSAIRCLQGVKSAAAMPYIKRALLTGDAYLQETACRMLSSYGKDARDAATYLVPVVTNKAWRPAFLATEVLGGLGPEAREAAPELVRLLNKETDPDRRRWIAGALKKIDPSISEGKP